MSLRARRRGADRRFEPTRHELPRVGPRQDDWWRGAVIYQIYPRSFRTRTATASATCRASSSGSTTSASLGVDAIWISPFFKTPMKDFGYDVADYCDVDPMFGTLADFDALLAEAHRLGLKVMIDLVLCHTTDQHAWFQESRASPRQPEGRLVRLGRRQARRHAAQQLAVGVRRPGLGVGAARAASTTCTTS